MKILYLDSDEKTKIILEQYKAIENNWEIISHEFFSISDIDQIDLVIVDFSNNKFKAILDEILEAKHDIRTITISEELVPSVSNGCEDCVKSFNRKRLVKPIDHKVLYEHILNFESCNCLFYNAFENLDNLISLIVKRFSSLNYDETNNKITSSDKMSDSYSMYQFLSMINILDKNNIDYTVLDENNLQINK